MRTFLGYRPNTEPYRPQGVADLVQFEGVRFTDGTVVVRWLGEYRSNALWDDWATFWHVHGEGTRIEWQADKGVPPGSGCRHCGLPFADPDHDDADHQWHRVTAGVGVQFEGSTNRTVTKVVDAANRAHAKALGYMTRVGNPIREEVQGSDLAPWRSPSVQAEVADDSEPWGT